jgi:hypothetical protein
MEKSIEKIWSDGFLANDALLVPKIKNLYEQKSIHIIDKFTRMFKINLISIVVFSLVLLVVTYIVDAFITGLIVFSVLSILVIINKKLLNGLKTIDNSMNSYHYLMSFNQWMKTQIEINKKMASFLYPIVFIAILLGVWFKDAEGVNLGERLVEEVLYGFPDIYLVMGVPLIGIIGVVVITGLLALFGGKIYQLDLNIVYGRVLTKLDTLLSDLKCLNE